MLLYVMHFNRIQSSKVKEYFILLLSNIISEYFINFFRNIKQYYAFDKNKTLFTLISIANQISEYEI